MLTIRLSRGGAKNRPFYTIVVTDSRHPRDGRNTERVGYFNPIATGGEIRLHIETDRITHWVSKGAQLSERVSHLLKEYEAAGKTAE
ncbi:MAG TPA: 30S ribosomal protein S16 [Gammaproteobacteria bacterium]|nr:30S ribosomal protein S16 [Gammaproteobacteria bacterium]